MAHVAMTPELSTWVADRIAAFPREAPESLRELSQAVAEYAALPLIWGWWDITAIRANGEIVSWCTEDEYSGYYSGVRPVEDRYHWLTALVIASRRDERLKALLPVRPASAVDCHHLGHPIFAQGKVSCPECCGLGWVEPADG